MDFEAQWSNAASTVVALVTTYGLRAIGAIIILIAGWMAAGFLYRGVVRLCAKSPRIDVTVALFLANGARYTMLLLTFVAVLTTFGIATTSFVAVLGALGLAIGLAIQGFGLAVTGRAAMRGTFSYHYDGANDADPEGPA